MFFSFNSLFSFGKELVAKYAVRNVAIFLTDKVLKWGSDKLITYGMEKVLTVLDPWSTLIRFVLQSVLGKIALAVYNVLDGRGLRNNVTRFFRKLMRHQPAQVIMV